MKIFFLLTLFAFSALALEIPVEAFDQSKLVALLRQIPSAQLKSETHPDFIRQHYLFPRGPSSFKIKCSADFYRASPYPSEQRCQVSVDEQVVPRRGDEFMLETNEAEIVSALFQSISYGLPEKKLFSNERVYGQSFEGWHRQLFRYSFSCNQLICRLTFATRPAL